MKKILIALGLMAVAALVLALVLRPVAKVAVVTPGAAVQLVPGSVVVFAEHSTEIKSETPGRVIRSELDYGKRFATGDVLLQIDPADLQLEIDRTQADYDAAKRKIAVGSATRLELESARENVENLDRLTKAGNYPTAEMEKQRRGLQQIEQKLAQEQIANDLALSTLENTLKGKRRQLEKMTIRAPFDGVISTILARTGDLISQGSPIAVLISTSRTVEAKISEENFAGILPGQKASVRFLGYGNWVYDATVTKILPTADPETQRYIVHLEVKIDPAKLVPGITGEVTITVGERQAEARIPRRALMGSSVYVVENGRVRLRKLELGYESNTIVEVLKGLKAGEQVIVDNLDLYHDGQRVKTEVAAGS